LRSCCATSCHLGLGERGLGAAYSRNKRTGRHRLYARDGTLLTDLVHGEQHPPCRGLTPEPICQRRTIDGMVPWLCCEGLAVVGLEILHCVSKKRGKRDVCAWIGRRLTVEESPDKRPQLLRCQSADTHRSAATSGHREIVPGAELRNLALQGR